MNKKNKKEIVLSSCSLKNWYFILQISNFKMRNTEDEKIY